MHFLDTAPADIDRADPAGAWARFRIDDMRRIQQSLHALCRGDAPVMIGLAHGPTFVAALWSVDEAQGRLHFTIDDSTVIDGRLLRATRLWGVGYEEGAKLQFDLRHFVLEHSVPQRLLHTAMPPNLYRLPRRESMRVRPSEAGAPTIRFRHPIAPERWTQLRAIDVSRHGCAMWRPLDALPLQLGMALLQAEVELDERTRFQADLTVQHLTPGAPAGGPAPGMRVGCRWDGLTLPAQQALAHWIRSGQGRQQRMSLSFEDSKV